MTRRALLPVPLVVLVVACGAGSTPSSPERDGSSMPSELPKAALPEPALPKPPPPEPTPESTASSLPAAPTFTAGPFEVRIDEGKPSPPSKLFPMVREEEDMRDHAWAFGWTTDGSAFAYCTVLSGADCKLCSFNRLDATTELLVSGEECDEAGATKLSGKQLKARLAERGVGLRDGEWAHGGELIVTTREVTGPPDNFDDSRSILEIGSARRDGSAQGEALREDGCTIEDDSRSCFIDAHPDVVAASPDGSSVAILAHFWEGESSDTFVLSIVPAGRLAAASYNRRGLDALKLADFETAATAFVAAMHADASAWKGPYNLACAYARAADPRARLALEAAVKRGGEIVRAKARKDADLDSVRAQPWFTTLIGPGK